MPPKPQSDNAIGRPGSSGGGGGLADAELIGLVYGELRKLAAGYMRRERQGHTLNATALVHEVYLKLGRQKESPKTRSQFLALAAEQMRRILVDHSRRRQAMKRAGREQRVSFQDALAVAADQPDDVIDVHDALTRFAVDYPRHAQVVELRFFGGCTEDEIAAHLRVSAETVKRDWTFAKTWLRREIRLGRE